MEKRTDYRRKMALRARKQRYAKVMVLSSFGILGASLIGATQAHAEEWTANTPESIQIEQGVTSYEMVKGDTLWAISIRINVNVETLAQVNNIDLASGQQYSLQVGTVISWTDKVVTATDANGTVIGQAPITESSKIVKDKAVGENVQQDVVNGNATDKDVQGDANNGNGSNSGNGGSQGGSNNGGNQGNEGENGGGETTPPEGGGEVTPPTNENRYVTVNVDESGAILNSTEGYSLVSESTDGGVVEVINEKGDTVTTYTTTRVWKKDAVTPPTDEFYVGQVLHQSQNFATPAEAELHMYDIAGAWYAYADAHGIDVNINAEGGGGAYYVKVVVTAVK